jgi:hypothetical protein
VLVHTVEVFTLLAERKRVESPAVVLYPDDELSLQLALQTE